MEYHKPVLLHQCINLLQLKPDGIYVDATFGGGGHSREIVKHLDTGHLYGFDQDEDAQGDQNSQEGGVGRVAADPESRPFDPPDRSGQDRAVAEEAFADGVNKNADEELDRCIVKELGAERETADRARRKKASKDCEARAGKMFDMKGDDRKGQWVDMAEAARKSIGERIRECVRGAKPADNAARVAEARAAIAHGGAEGRAQA